VRQQEPLTREELERLWRRERQMTWFHAAAMGVFLLAAVAAFHYGDFAWFRHVLLGLIVILVLAATILQLRERCPRCGTRLRTKILMQLPDKCGACGVAFTRPASASR